MCGSFDPYMIKNIVTPAKAGAHTDSKLDSRLRGNDDYIEMTKRTTVTRYLLILWSLINAPTSISNETTSLERGQKMRWIFLSATHAGMIAVGFALGIYLLPILTAPDSLDRDMLAATAQNAEYKATFTKDLAGSDFLHWGEGDVSISFTKIVHQGKMAPGPNYKLYLVKEFVEDEAGFLAIKDQAQVIGDIKTFDGVVLDVPAGVDINAYNTVLVWCEAFQEFITAAKYR